MSALLAVENLVVSYSPSLPPAVNGVSFEVAAGEVLGLLGGNGAGKTSTLRTLAGVQPPTSGAIRIGAETFSTAVGAERARALLGYCPDTAGLLRQASVREHIAIALALHGHTAAWPAALELVERFGLTHVLDRDTMGFSHGMSRRLSVVLAALTAEKVLILDEPFDGVDPLGVEATTAVIQAAKDAGLAVIVSTHLLSLLTVVCDRVAVMVRGNIVDEADAAAFHGDAGVERYSLLLQGA